MGIKQYFFDKKIKKAKLKALNYRKDMSLSKISKVIIFVDGSTSFNQKSYKELQKLLNLTTSDFTFLSYKDKKSSFNEFNGVVMTQDSINWKANVKSESLQRLLDEKFDLLIDYTNDGLELKYLIIPKINAAFKIGFSEKYADLYNFMVQVASGEIKTFNVEIARYLKILKLI